MSTELYVTCEINIVFQLFKQRLNVQTTNKKTVEHLK